MKLVIVRVQVWCQCPLALVSEYLACNRRMGCAHQYRAWLVGTAHPTQSVDSKRDRGELDLVVNLS